MDLTDTVGPHVTSGALPGVAALIGRGTDEVEAAVLGSPSFEAPTTLRRDAIFRIASVTKPMVAVLAMLLVEDGTVRLDDSVEDLLPEFADRQVLRDIGGPLDDTVPADRPITLEDLLSLRFGFGFSPELPFPGTTPIQEAETALELKTLGPPWPPAPFDNAEWMRRLGTLPLLAQPGSTWMYNTGLHVTGVLLERAAGIGLGDLLQARLCAPLGMVDTGFMVPADQVHRLTTQYAADAATGALQVIDEGDDTSWWAAPPAKPDASGGLVSTLDDVWAFGRMMAGGGRHEGQALISPASFALLTTNRLTEAQRKASTLFVGEAGGWGFGMGTPVDGVGSFGWEGGTGTSWRMEPRSGTTVIVLTQRAMDSPQPPPLFRAVWSYAWGAP
jgi:CubicO group peptidase (beta-lactamase class C family)